MVWLKEKGNNNTQIKETQRNEYETKNCLQDLWAWRKNVTKAKRENNKLEHMV